MILAGRTHCDHPGPCAPFLGSFSGALGCTTAFVYHDRLDSFISMEIPQIGIKIKIALIHDWLTGIGGDVRVLKALHEMYPEAPIYCLYYDKRFTDECFPNTTIIPSFLQKSFIALRLYSSIASKIALPFAPSAIESFDLSDHDLVISTGSIFSKGLVLRPKTRHINYCHSPTRQVWDLSFQALHATRFALHKKMLQHVLRIWDRHASTRVDRYIANSENVRARIKKYYQRDAEVIYPPVGIGRPEVSGKALSSHDYFLIVSRLYKHKNIDIAVRAFNKLGWPLVIVGDGPERSRLEKIAESNVQFLGYQSDASCSMLYASCSAFIMPQEEDFGIAPVEAMSHGKPVLALKRGGSLEYIQPGINGLFFEDPIEEILADGVRRIREQLANFDPKIIAESVQRFSIDRFKTQIKSSIALRL